MMALVTVQRSPSVSSSPQSSDSGAGAPADDEDSARSCKSLSECYFAGKGAALVLPPNERARPSRRVSAAGCDIQQHLQSMFYLLRPEETLKMAVKLESVHPGRTRYLVVVSCTGRQDAEESCLLGIDCHARATVGLVLRVLADTAITLDGDGGFSVSVCGRQHIFKPVSVQAMWSALQTLHKVSSKAREQNYFLGGLSHDWVTYYEQRIESDRSCLNEWHAMDSLESRRPPSPDSVRNKPRERDETERVIRSTLKEIMMSVDLDEVTSKYIRGRLEEDLDMDLGEFKPFIDQEMLTILGQMDAPTEIFDHVYLGSEWNASNLEELQKNGVRHILNVTREIDNFFPGMFNYLNVRVYDDEKTDLLKHWDDTFKYITKAKKEGSKVLVHCKMGVSRSASVVIAYAMKAYNWDFSQAWKHVKEKRNCIKPNNSFLLQLETYQGILDAMKNKEKLQRSKSDTNLKSPTAAKEIKKEEKLSVLDNGLQETSGAELKRNNERPKSWSPNIEVADNMLPVVPLSQSLESIDKSGTTEVTRENLLRNSKKSGVDQEARNVLMPCDNGQSYSVSQNQIVHLPGLETATPSVKHVINQLETQGQRRKGLVLNLTNQFEAASSKPSSPGSDSDSSNTKELLQSPKLSPVDKQLLENGINAANTTQEIEEDKEEMSLPEIVSSSFLKKKEITEEEDEVGRGGDESAAEVAKTRNATSSLIPDKSLVWTTTTTTTTTTSTSTTRATSTATGVVVTSATNYVNTNNPETSNETAEPPLAGSGAGKRTVPRDGDPFSTQVDKVFEREEKRGDLTPAPCNSSSVSAASASTRESPSRQSSWSSYDSAVVLDNNNSVHSSWATLPSRNSSWGSYDMRPSSNAVENSPLPAGVHVLGTSGLFPYDKEEIPWYPGTVKRTKQKLEENTTTSNVKRVCTQSSDNQELLDTVETYNPVLLHYALSSPVPNRRDLSPSVAERLKMEAETMSTTGQEPIGSSSSGIDIGNGTITNNGNNKELNRLSTSAPLPSSLTSESVDLQMPLRSCRSESETSSPCVVNTTQCPSVKHHKMVLENLNNKTMFSKRCLSVDDSSELDTGSRNVSGIVKNLKKEFEAKSILGNDNNKSNENNYDPSSVDGNLVITRNKRDVKIRSLPSSPVIGHNESKIQTSSTSIDIRDANNHQEMAKNYDSSEDLSVRVLVGKYEQPERKNAHRRKTSTSSSSSEIQLRMHKDRDFNSMQIHPPAKSKIAPEFARRSAPVIINSSPSALFHETFENALATATTTTTTTTVNNNNANVTSTSNIDIANTVAATTTCSSSSSSPSGTLIVSTGSNGRPPVPSPSVVVASVVAKAASKKQQQHGRTHPLARLQVRPRHSSPVYNTM